MTKKEATAIIESGIDECFNQDKITGYLDSMSKHYDYSYMNIIMINKQMPEATRVASGKAWNDVNRYLMPGAKSIEILCPELRYNDRATGRLDARGNKVIEKNPEFRFAIRNVYDISATTGKELPAESYDYEKSFEALRLATNYRIVEADEELSSTMESNIACDHTIKTIFLRHGMNQEDRLKAAVYGVFESREASVPVPDKYKSFVKDAAAYVVLNRLGLDSVGDSVSSNALSGMNGANHEDKRRCITRILSEAKAVIDELEGTRDIKRSINGKKEENVTEAILEDVKTKLQDNDISLSDIGVNIYSVSPKPKTEVLMYIHNDYYSYQATMKVTGLTVHEIEGLINLRENYSYINEYLESHGAVCELYESSEDVKYDISFDMLNYNLKVINPDKVEHINAMISYQGDMKEDSVFNALSEENINAEKALVQLNPVKIEKPAEPYTERLERYETAENGMDSSIPMVSITYDDTEVCQNINISRAVKLVREMDANANQYDTSKYMNVSISYVYNDWKYEHIQNLDISKGRINFIDYLNLPVNIVNHLKSHERLVDMCQRAEQYAPDTTYGRNYGLRMNKWAGISRMELNHKSDSPVISRPPLLDELYGINENGHTENLVRG